MIDIDYDRFYDEFDLELLTSPIGKFNRKEVEQILDNIDITNIDIAIDLFRLRGAVLKSLDKKLTSNEILKNKLDWLNGRDAYELIFRATIIDRIKTMQQINNENKS